MTGRFTSANPYSRRSIIGILGGWLGLAGLGIAISEHQPRDPTPESINAAQLATVATTLYPSDIADPEPIVNSYITSLPDSRIDAIATTIADLDTLATQHFGRSLDSLSTREVDALLRTIGAHRAQPVATGSVSERVRYHLINGLLISLFSQPAGSTLIDIGNPRGYPGGYATVLTTDEEW